MRKTQFVNNEFYHIFNRGVDKRNIFLNEYDIVRFFQSINEFNVIEPIGSIYENSFGRSTSKLYKRNNLVNFIAYCLNQNHYHFILEQLVDGGIVEFMKRLGGYTKYFNNRYKRNGVLFQGRYKSIHIDSNEYLLHLSAYVNLNNYVHAHSNKIISLSKSSWDEYVSNDKNDFCNKDIILGQFMSTEEYKGFAEDSLKNIRENRELEELLLE